MTGIPIKRRPIEMSRAGEAIAKCKMKKEKED